MHIVCYIKYQATKALPLITLQARKQDRHCEIWGAYL